MIVVRHTTNIIIIVIYCFDFFSSFCFFFCTHVSVYVIMYVCMSVNTQIIFCGSVYCITGHEAVEPKNQ